MTQDTLIENTEKPGSIPNRPLKITELVDLKYLAEDAKDRASTLYRAMLTYQVSDKFEEEYVGEEIMDNFGKFCDKVTAYCQTELKKAEVPKKRKGGKI